MKQLTQAVVEQWVSLASGQFNVRSVWNELGIESPEGKSHLRVILGRLKAKGLLAKDPSRDDIYRIVDSEISGIDWQAADPKKTIPLKFPFELEAHARIYPKSIIILAGSKNAGKTAWLYNFIILNMGKFKIDLFNSETGPEQMNERFSPFDIPTPAPFNVYERYDNFSDVIHPDHISVIDYLDFNSEVYLVGAEIDAIFRKLNKGVAVIGLQKPPPSITFVKGVKKVIERDLAYGGGFTAKRSVLYISMGGNKLKLVYVKTPAVPTVNPNNMAWSFSFNSSGSHFENIQRHFGEE
ncbi:hypothetical protein LCGC14_0416970 [marine sediment metagenome]|uniref:Uncharacterized protein n=1 Tax=marine sediment metagenome TaxID=412755 RepID=A0A0F9W1C4_9ZZZZ